MSLALLLGVATVVLWLALSALLWWRRPPRPVGPLVVAFVVSGLLWSVGELGASFLAKTPEAHWGFLLLLYTGIVVNGPLWWALALAFTSQHGVRPRWASPLVQYAPLALSAVAFAALVTNPWHGQFLVPVLNGRNLYGPFWYFQALYGYAALLASLGVIVWAYRQQPSASRARSRFAVLFAASAAPLVANFLWVSRAAELGFDPTLPAFGLGLILVFAGILRADLFSLSGLTLEHWWDHESDGVVILDEEGRLVRANPAAPKVLGVTELPPDCDFVELLAETLEDPAGAPARLPRGSLLALLESRDPREADRVFRRAFPLKGWIRVESRRLPGRWPSSGGLVVRLRDETRLQETSFRAARQAASIEAILGSIRDGLFVVDEAGALLHANERFWEMWRLSQVVPLTMDEERLLADLSLRSERPSVLRALVEETGPGSDEGIEVALKSGQVFSVTAAPLRLSGRRIGRVWTFRDVTERHRAELERARIEEGIRESQKLESLGVLAGGIAHDFNNILVGVLGNVDLAAKTLEPGSAAYRHLLGIRSSSDRAAELVQQLLAYAGRGRTTVRRLDLSSLVAETKDLVLSAVSKKARLQTRLAPEVFVEGDPVQLRQIVMNLLTNASDALGDEEGVIGIESGVRRVASSELDDALPQRTSPAPSGEYAFLEIRDSGCGMDSRSIARIFEPFFSTKFTGRGLGLSAALGIVRTHGGYIKVRSAPGRGSSFLLLLPLVEAPSAGSADVPSAAIGEAPSVPATVLVVDDEEVVRDVARAALELEGYRVLLARDGHEGVSLFREHQARIEAIVLDMTMPRLDGAEALFALRQISRGVPVILSSGYSEQDTMARCAGLAAVGFIQKPYTPERLIAKVNEALRVPVPRHT